MLFFRSSLVSEPVGFWKETHFGTWFPYFFWLAKLSITHNYDQVRTLILNTIMRKEWERGCKVQDKVIIFLLGDDCFLLNCFLLLLVLLPSCRGGYYVLYRANLCSIKIVLTQEYSIFKVSMSMLKCWGIFFRLCVFITYFPLIITMRTILSLENYLRFFLWILTFSENQYHYLIPTKVLINKFTSKSRY